MKPNWEQLESVLQNAKKQWDGNVARLPETLQLPGGPVSKDAVGQFFAQLLSTFEAIVKRDDLDPMAVAYHQPTVQTQINNLPSLVSHCISNPQNPTHINNFVATLWAIKTLLAWLVPARMQSGYERTIKKSGLIEQIAGMNKTVGEIYAAGQQASGIAGKIKQDGGEVDSILTKVKAVSQEIEKIQTATHASATAAANDRQMITDSLAELKAGLKQYDTLKTGIESLRANAEETLEGASKVGLALSFSKRRRSLFHTQIFWFLMFAVGIIGLILIALFVGLHLSASGPPQTFPEYIELIWRVALEGPAIWFTWFAAVHYGRVSKLLEDYGYKEAVALAYVGYRNEFGDDPETLKKLQESAIKSFGSNPVSLLEGADPATPVHDLLDRCLKKIDPEKLAEAVLALAGNK